MAVTDACCEFLARRDRAGAERPFCLVTGYVLPHCPFICPRDLYEEYYHRVEVPAVPEGYLDRLHPAIKLWREKRGVNGLSDDAVRRARAAYYGLVTFMDGLIGRLLETLASTSFADNTAVIYLSDHGEMAGEHGMWWKSSFYDGSSGVPMIASFPGRFNEGAARGCLDKSAGRRPHADRPGRRRSAAGGHGQEPEVFPRGRRDGRTAGRTRFFPKITAAPTSRPDGWSGRVRGN